MKNLRQQLQQSKTLTAEAESPKVSKFEGPTGKLKSHFSDVGAELERLQALAPSKLDPGDIVDSRFRDRLDVSAELDELIDSIRQHGQKIAILVRPLGKAHALDHQKYEVVYGRRRLSACKALGIKVNAIISDMSEDDALRAQGIENAARLETSYIERAFFAHQMREAGKSETEICSILNKERAEVSRMKTLLEIIPVEVIEALGPVKDGRRPWEALKVEVSKSKASCSSLLKLIDQETPLNDRLAQLTRELRQGSASPAPRKKPVTKKVGKGFVAVRRSRDLTLKSQSPHDVEFIDFVQERLEALHKEWRESQPK